MINAAARLHSVESVHPPMTYPTTVAVTAAIRVERRSGASLSVHLSTVNTTAADLMKLTGK